MQDIKNLKLDELLANSNRLNFTLPDPHKSHCEATDAFRG